MKRKEYCIEDFLLTEHDQNGRSEPVYFRIPPLLLHDVYQLLDSGKLPFQTKEEFFRWAFCVGVQSFKKVKYFDYSSPLLTLPLTIFEKCEPVDVQEFFRRVHKIIRDLSALGCRESDLQRFIAAVEELIQCLPSQYQREEYLTTLEEHRRVLLSSARWPDHPSRKGYSGR
jgi:hypothetical protein